MPCGPECFGLTLSIAQFCSSKHSGRLNASRRMLLLYRYTVGSPVFLKLLALIGGVYDCGQSFFSILFSRGYCLVNCSLQVIGNVRDCSDPTLRRFGTN